jgi:hypothetical protein
VFPGFHRDFVAILATVATPFAFEEEEWAKRDEGEEFIDL